MQPSVHSTTVRNTLMLTKCLISTDVAIRKFLNILVVSDLFRDDFKCNFCGLTLAKRKLTKGVTSDLGISPLLYSLKFGQNLWVELGIFETHSNLNFSDISTPSSFSR